MLLSSSEQDPSIAFLNENKEIKKGSYESKVLIKYSKIANEFLNDKFELKKQIVEFAEMMFSTL